WEPDGEGVRVTTDRGSYQAARLIIAGGAWAGDLLAELGLPLTVWRILHVHFEPDDEARFGLGRCPWAIWQVPEGIYASFTALPGHGVKFGRHDIGEVTTPQEIRRSVNSAEVASLRQQLNRFLPGAG